MVSKIELYREVLDIEPNSKVFFPLARQLCQEGRQDEAVAVLTSGIGMHPDHLEAKFLLLETLTRLGREGQADAVFADVGALLARYPSVWLLWSKTAAARSKDPALAMLFLAHYFQNQTLTWAEVMERGLQSLSQTAVGAESVPASGRDAVVAAPPAAMPAMPAAAPAAVAPSPEVSPPTPERDPDDGPPLRGAREVMELAGLLAAPEVAAEKGRTRSARTRDHVVRTKTMAALLAGQGDTAGALEIYEELLATAASGPEREELCALVSELSPATGAAPSPEPIADTAASAPEAGASPPPAAPRSKGAAKLVSILEALAGRLEARAGT